MYTSATTMKRTSIMVEIYGDTLKKKRTSIMVEIYGDTCKH